MNTALRDFLLHYLRVVIAALVPVVLTAFLSMPFNLGGHPGEMRPHVAASDQQVPTTASPRKVA